MMRTLSLAIVLALAPITTAAPLATAYRDDVAPLIQQHCIKCHGPTKQAGDVRFDTLSDDIQKDVKLWTAIREQLRDGTMPPPKEPRIPDEKVRSTIAWISAGAGVPALRLPNQGNLIPHELLFGVPAIDGTAPAPRVWRLSPDAYLGFVRDLSRGKVPGIVQPFTLVPDRGFKDYAALYTIDEPSTEILIRNAEAIVAAQTAHTIKDGKVVNKNDTVREFVNLMAPEMQHTPAQLEGAVRLQYKMAMGRTPSEDEVKRFLGLYEKCAKGGDRPGAVRTMLQAVLLRTDAVFRSELPKGEGPDVRMLAPLDLAVALSLAIGDRRDSNLMKAAEKGELRTREQVKAQILRILDDPKADHSRLLGFFQEYFEYGHADDVFKDKPKDFTHLPRQYIADTDQLIQHILQEDKDVLKQLLTTPKSFVNFTMDKKKRVNGQPTPKRAVVLNKNNNPNTNSPEQIYGLKEWTDEQPVVLPENTRLGILMQPSWLIAWSTNFDNDVVRRGRWVRERLLGGTVPDLPIGVIAQVPEDPHRGYRDKLQVTRDASCWKCHKRMDELGLPFEQFDHYGWFRTTESVLDSIATEKNVDKKGKNLGPVIKQIPLSTAGTIAESGDTKLDGPVKDPREFVQKLAASERVRQVFVRHVFRYYLGRNESLADARTLQEADKAYVASGGSFRALLVSLLTSESFLMRKAKP